MERNRRDRGRSIGRAKLEADEHDRESGLNALASRNARGADITRAGGPAAAPAPAQRAWTAAQRERFHALYREHFDFVYRNLRRLGVPDAGIDDALQDVYLVVLRHIDGYRPGTHARAWLFAITMRIASNYRRARRRRGTLVPLDGDEVDVRPDPFDFATRSQAGRILHAFLDGLDEDRRAVFVMAELEQMTAPEIALTLSANLNTVYSRLRAARAEFEHTLAERHRRGQPARARPGEPGDD